MTDYLINLSVYKFDAIIQIKINTSNDKDGSDLSMSNQ